MSSKLRVGLSNRSSLKVDREMSSSAQSRIDVETDAHGQQQDIIPLQPVL